MADAGTRSANLGFIGLIVAVGRKLEEMEG